MANYEIPTLVRVLGTDDFPAAVLAKAVSDRRET
jgi:hypothetical protein